MGHSISKDDWNLDYVPEPDDKSTLSALEFALEGFVDSKGLAFMLEALANICYGKLQHLVGDLQMHPDSADARYWSRGAAALLAAQHRIDRARQETHTYLK